MHVLHIVGARPNFMKVAPVMAAFAKHTHVRQTLVHTGQHYDDNMSRIFFQELSIPKPDVSLGVGSASHAVQTAKIMIAFEQTLLAQQPEMVLVYGDINSTMAAALVCAKLNVRFAHVEAGLRSRDRTMPEEINRIVTDQLADVLLTPSRDADGNLLQEGIAQDKIHLVGNVMIDTLTRLSPRFRLPEIEGVDGDYALVTLHRPSNVDSPETLRRILNTLTAVSQDCRIIFPVHPRTRDRIATDISQLRPDGRIVLTQPLGYLDFLGLQQKARVVITDSGGIQEETTYFGVPCLTLRSNTERPVTVQIGTNQLIGSDMNRLQSAVTEILDGRVKIGRIPEYWDGNASERIAALLAT